MASQNTYSNFDYKMSRVGDVVRKVLIFAKTNNPHSAFVSIVDERENQIINELSLNLREFKWLLDKTCAKKLKSCTFLTNRAEFSFEVDEYNYGNIQIYFKLNHKRKLITLTSIEINSLWSRKNDICSEAISLTKSLLNGRNPEQRDFKRLRHCCEEEQMDLESEPSYDVCGNFT